MKYSIGSCIFVFLATIQGGVRGFQWTSSSTLPDNSTVPICGGRDLTLAWDYRTDSGEQVVNVEWRFQPLSGTTEDVLATQVNGHFFADPSVHQRLEYIPGAGIRLYGATDQYSGTYTVRVNLNAHGAIQMLSQSVIIIVTNESIATSDRLQAQQEGARFMLGDQQHHILLTCGHFSPLWQPSVEVVWTDPQNRTLASTLRESGQFVLAVPNPVLDGAYACHIDDNSPAAGCLASDSPLRDGATVQLDGVQAGMALVSSQLQRLQQQLQQMVPELHDLQANHSLLLQQFNILLAQRKALASQLQALVVERENLTATLQNLTHTAMSRITDDMRLVGGSSIYEGRVEVKIGNDWGTVCSTSFGVADATVVCKHMGYLDAGAQVRTGGFFGIGSGPVLLENLGCFGTETNIFQCQRDVSSSHCTHNMDVGVICQHPVVST